MLNCEKRRQTLIVRLRSELDHGACLHLRPRIDEMLRDSDLRRLVFDFQDVDFMDSSGIGFIIGRCKIMRKRGGSVAVVNADARINRIFEMSGLYQIVERMA